MSPSEYEEYVSEVVKQLGFVEALGMAVSRNVKLDGVKQPGKYEVDVLVKGQPSGKFDFLMVVECKNWTRPVDRPVVQKLVQTRDAVAAHKAAVASPVGFSKEAIQVAQANGVALWVVSRAEWVVVMGASGTSQPHVLAREKFLSELGLEPTSLSTESKGPVLLSAESATPDPGEHWQHRFRHRSFLGSALADVDNRCGIDSRLASTQLIDELARALGVSVAPACRSND